MRVIAVTRRFAGSRLVGAACVVATTLSAITFAEETSPAAPLIPNARIPLEGMLTGGQPTLAQFELLARTGWRTVINLRTEDEQGFEWESATAARLGIAYVQIPVAGAAGLTRANVERLDAALRDARFAGPVVLHCASGNRAGALLALREKWLNGASSEAALVLGRAAGLTSLEPETRKILGLEAEPVPTSIPR